MVVTEAIANESKRVGTRIHVRVGGPWQSAVFRQIFSGLIRLTRLLTQLATTYELVSWLAAHSDLHRCILKATMTTTTASILLLCR